MNVAVPEHETDEFNHNPALPLDLTSLFNSSSETKSLSGFAGIIGQDEAMQDVFRQIRELSPYSYPVLISGDTGTGKECVASAVHEMSRYGNGGFVPINCGAIPEGIVESELFGHVRGAFSGAMKDRKGRFELADQGTLFLDEIAELPPGTQVKLLRFLEDGTFEKVGTEERISVDVRIISATNKNLKEEVRKGKFREDLFYRLNVIPIHLPPLRKRKKDIPLLAAHFLKDAERENGKPIPKLTADALDLLLQYDWPGNVRQLKNAIQFSIVRSRSYGILPADLPGEITRSRNCDPQRSSGAVAADKREPAGKLTPENVKEMIRKTSGNKSKAARLLGVARATLYRFLDKNSDIKTYVDQF